MHKLAVLAVCFLLLASAVLFGASKSAKKSSASSKKAASKKSASAKSSKSPGASKTAARKGSTSKTKAGRRSRSRAKKTASARKASPRSTAQRTPTPERYQEIQQALADRGFYQGPVTGGWGPESVDALKRFQQQQNLSSNGKLDALSLKALGLGAKRDPTPLNATTTGSASSSTTTSQKEPSQP